ncbi:hypothetical protein IFR04_010491 [Cadophora malorum]|uniref:Transcription factor domain-containing protein n=1 Tax=Cadophora malorum TaxID=108018 RepID=A0A8H7W5S9_9HELO|nr:hypothetical protein IFR04_010491 [Cadophora malorum]
MVLTPGLSSLMGYSTVVIVQKCFLRLALAAKRRASTAKQTRISNVLRQEVEVTTQLNAIQKALNEREISVDLTTPSAVVSEHGSNGAENSLIPPRDTFYRYSGIADFPPMPLALGDIFLATDQLRELFDHFEQNYYHTLPILDTDFTIAELHKLSQVLFWAIIIISSRWHPSLSHLYPSLVTGYRDILSKTLLEPMNTIESIQAILMLCVWPFDFWRKIEDPSWSYCGFATNAATKLRIHENCTHGLSAKSNRIRKKTWLACIHVNCILSQGWLIGVPVLQELLTTPATLQTPCTLSEQRFLAKVEILRTLSKSSANLSSVGSTTHAWNFALNLGSDFDSLREKYESCWDHKSEVLLLGAKLCLYNLQLDLDSRARNASVPSVAELDNNTERRNFINTIYLISIQLVHRFQSLGTADGTCPNWTSPYRHLPKFYFWLIIISMAFIFKVRIIYYTILKLKPEETDPHVRDIHDIFSTWSRDENDHAARGVKLVDMILKAEKSVDLRAIVSTSEGRPGSVVLSDLVAIATRLREDTEREAKSAKEVDRENGMSEDTVSVDATGAVAEGPMLDLCFDWEIPWELDMLSQDPYAFLTGL